MARTSERIDTGQLARSVTVVQGKNLSLVSGAGHDACYVSRVAPTAMVFVPCKDGISHNEIEDASKVDIGAGCQILLQAMVERANA